MNREELLQTKSPSIQSLIQPLFCIVSYKEKLSPFMDRRNIKARQLDNIRVTTIDTPIEVSGNTKSGNHISKNNNITPASISEFLSLSRKYLGLVDDD